MLNYTFLFSDGEVEKNENGVCLYDIDYIVRGEKKRKYKLILSAPAKRTGYIDDVLHKNWYEYVTYLVKGEILNKNYLVASKTIGAPILIFDESDSYERIVKELFPVRFSWECGQKVDTFLRLANSWETNLTRNEIRKIWIISHFFTHVREDIYYCGGNKKANHSFFDLCTLPKGFNKKFDNFMSSPRTSIVSYFCHGGRNLEDIVEVSLPEIRSILETWEVL